VSHETIYLSLFVQSRGALPKELARYLRSGRVRRRPRGLSVMNGQGQLRGTVHISQRPAEASDRAVPGHWEGDLLFGTRSSTVATLVERTSRFVMLVGVPGGHTADVVADALAEAITTLPAQLRRSLTWDQGNEMAGHARFSVATGVPVYFCDPHIPWQRAATRTPTGCCASISPGAPTSGRSRSETSMPSPLNSTTALDNRSDGSHHVRHWTRRCDDRLRSRVVMCLCVTPWPRDADPAVRGDRCDHCVHADAHPPSC
jgi:Integrase core domain